MRAIEFSENGDPHDVLRVVDRPTPPLERGQVRVRLHAAAINPSDLIAVRGGYGPHDGPPVVPGLEGSGTVVAHRAGPYGAWLTGRRVTVFGGGTWAEEAVADVNRVLPAPTNLDDAMAAMAFVNPFTAFALTRCVLGLGDRKTKKPWLLQTAAASAVGRMIVRLGRRDGFRTCCVVRRDQHAAELKELGADAAVVFDAETDPVDDLRAKIAEATDGPIDAAVDPVGGKLGTALVDLLAPDGRLVCYGSLSGEPLAVRPRTVINRGLSVEPFFLRRWMTRRPKPALLRDVLAVRRRLSDGTLALPPGEGFPLERISDAIAASTRPGRSAKPWLQIGT
ncbi:MAG: zinc-dependent alcohol dehydrogenase family protein [Planctomycetota bacterium]